MLKIENVENRKCRKLEMLKIEKSWKLNNVVHDGEFNGLVDVFNFLDILKIENVENFYFSNSDF